MLDFIMYIMPYIPVLRFSRETAGDTYMRENEGEGGKEREREKDTYRETDSF